MFSTTREATKLKANPTDNAESVSSPPQVANYIFTKARQFKLSISTKHKELSWLDECINICSQKSQIFSRRFRFKEKFDRSIQMIDSLSVGVFWPPLTGFEKVPPSKHIYSS